MTSLRICVAGSWDAGFHRNRTLIRMLQASGADLTLCHVELWRTPRESLVQKGRLGVLVRACFVYPLLVWRFMRTRRADVVVVPYPGHFDMIVLAPLCRLRGIPIVFDMFISLFDTIVQDRKLASRRSAIGLGSLIVDRLSCHLADLIVADTPPHASFFSTLTGVDAGRFRVVWLGAQEDVFHPLPDVEVDPALVLFHGTFVPLQGLSTIVLAGKHLEDTGVRIRLIGDGQQGPEIDRLIRETCASNVERTGLIPLSEVPLHIAAASVCLGIFGTSGKAERAVPNKLYECLAVGRAVVTADTPAIRAAFREGEVVTTPTGDSLALARAIRSLLDDPVYRERIAEAGHRRFKENYSQRALTAELTSHIRELLQSRSRG